ncbi:VOC family protein [Azospirillum sp. sgz302134]
MEPTIYLFFKGDCLEAMTHYAETLGGEVVDVLRNADVPDADCRMPGGDDRVMHMTVKLGATTVMASDTPDSMYSTPQGFAVTIAPPSRAEFDRIFEALAKDARFVAMPPGETFWAERFAMFTDRFGTPWMLNHAGAKAATADVSR